MQKILIIDSDRETTGFISEQLTVAGYAAEVAETAADGISMSSDASLIILAVELPDQNGFAVCSTFKRSPKTAGIPIFLVSSADSDAAFRQHIEMPNHADAYFLKPLDIDVLLEEIDSFFVEEDGYDIGDDLTEDVPQEEDAGLQLQQPQAAVPPQIPHPMTVPAGPSVAQSVVQNIPKIPAPIPTIGNSLGSIKPISIPQSAPTTAAEQDLPEPEPDLYFSLDMEALDFDGFPEDEADDEQSETDADNAGQQDADLTDTEADAGHEVEEDLQGDVHEDDRDDVFETEEAEAHGMEEVEYQADDAGLYDDGLDSEETEVVTDENVEADVMESSESEMATYEAIEELSEKNAELTSQIDKMKAENAELQLTRDTLQEECRSLHAQIEAMRQAIGALASQFGI